MANPQIPTHKAITEGDYFTVAASQTDASVGANPKAGNYLLGLLVVPTSVSPGSVQIKDGSGSAITVFAGGASSLASLVPFFVPLGIVSVNGAWKVTTGSNISVIAVGMFN